MSRIEDLRGFSEGEFARFVFDTLYWRSRVRSQIEGTYRELSLGGYSEPKPFTRLVVPVNANEAEYVTIFEPRRPPYQSPRVSHYWLDGMDRKFFAIDYYMDNKFSYESVVLTSPLEKREYTVYFNQYHKSLPNDAQASEINDEWWSVDTTEFIVVVSGSEQPQP